MSSRHPIQRTSLAIPAPAARSTRAWRSEPSPAMTSTGRLDPFQPRIRWANASTMTSYPFTGSSRPILPRMGDNAGIRSSARIEPSSASGRKRSTSTPFSMTETRSGRLTILVLRMSATAFETATTQSVRARRDGVEPAIQPGLGERRVHVRCGRVSAHRPCARLATPCTTPPNASARRPGRSPRSPA